MAVMHTTMISASITAYSTAVGPLSSFRKLTTDREKLASICSVPFASPTKGPTSPPCRSDRFLPRCPHQRARASSHLSAARRSRRRHGGPVALRTTLLQGGLPLSRSPEDSLVAFSRKHGSCGAACQGERAVSC